MMKRVNSRLTGRVGFVLMAALVMALALGASVAAAEPLAPNIPTFPHFFEGKVTTDQNISLPNAVVTARAANPGGWTGAASTTVDAASKYGYAPQFYVPGWVDSNPSTGARSGEQIAFFVEGVQALLYDVDNMWPSRTYTFTPGADTLLNLIVPLRYTIEASHGPNGSISPEGAVSVPYFFNQQFTFTPDPNYLIRDVLVDGVSNPGAVAAGSYTFTNVTRNHTIHVTFVPATYVITPNAGVGCTITPPNPVTVPYKGSQIFNIAANTGYSLVDVLVNGASQGPILSYTFSDVRADGTIAATCRKIAYRVYLPMISK